MRLRIFRNGIADFLFLCQSMEIGKAFALLSNV